MPMEGPKTPMRTSFATTGSHVATLDASISCPPGPIVGAAATIAEEEHARSGVASR